MELTIKLKDEQKEGFLLELLAALDFVEVVKARKKSKANQAARSTEEQVFLEEFKQSLHEVDLAVQGKIKLKSLKEVLAEI